MLTIDFLTDYVCPFCLVTKENLRAALKTLHQEAEIIEHPYALTPEGSEPTDICDEEHRAYFARLKEPAETVGLNMQLPPEINKDAALCLALKNTVKPEHSAVESNRIGLKSSTRNMERMGGKLVVFQTDTLFEVTLSFPVTAP